MEEGDYVRTEWGDIERIVRVDNDNIIVEIEEDEDGRTYSKMCYKEDIIKSSPNIIDILEVGDILVIKDFVDEACMIFTDIYLIQNEEQLLHIKNDLEKNKNKMLYSIATKEQFKNIEYEVK